MRYSYTKPRKKSIFTPELKLAITFFMITLGMLFLTYGFLSFKDFSFQSQKAEMIQKRFDLGEAIEAMKAEVALINKESLLGERITTQNSVLKDSITNLFDLIPQRITLSEASLLENGLILHGITPNKDIYNFMLQAPLRSIFHKTYSSFYPLSNGWLRFVSTNYIEDDSFENNMTGTTKEKTAEEGEDEN
ncbi:MAG: hypothetical protein WBK95_06260 [Sulfurimonas sp.]|jgi:hypothetical protein|nr:hypothetical protein [Sulfurimonas sp.]MDD3059527.1 hypothetical protein [Sulfurimonas sp.]